MLPANRTAVLITSADLIVTNVLFMGLDGLLTKRDAQYGAGLPAIAGVVSPMSGPCSEAIAGSLVSVFCSQLVRTTEAEQTSSMPTMASFAFMGVELVVCRFERSDKKNRA